MTAIATSRAFDRAAISAADTATLRAELSRALKLTADHLIYLAGIWVELEKRGEDLSKLRVGFAAYLPAIAAGSVSAEAVVAFAGEPRKLKAVAKLPVDEQVKLARGEKQLPNLTWKADTGHTKGVCRSPVKMTPRTPSRTVAEFAAGPRDESLVKSAAVGTARDVAELCMEMVKAAENPADVATRLQVMLTEFLATAPKAKRLLG